MFGIGLIYNSERDECVCQNETYRNITYKYNSTYNYIVCQPSPSSTTSNTNNTNNINTINRNLQANRFILWSL